MGVRQRIPSSISNSSGAIHRTSACNLEARPINMMLYAYSLTGFGLYLMTTSYKNMGAMFFIIGHIMVMILEYPHGE